MSPRHDIDTKKMSAPHVRYGHGVVTGLFVRTEKRLYPFDRFTEAGEAKRFIMIGRQRTCDIQIAGAEVSRIHCKIERRPDGTCIIFDVESTNGIRVNDVRVTQTVLRPGMWIHIGTTELIAVGDDKRLPITGSNYTSFLVNAKEIHGTAEAAAPVIHRSASTIYRAIQLRKRTKL